MTMSDEDDGNGGGGGPASPEEDPRSRRLVAPSTNNFETYWRTKLGRRRGDGGGGDRDEAEAEGRRPFGGAGRDNAGAEGAERRPERPPPPPRPSDRSAATSPFSDSDRSRTVDRFANLFMERMGRAMSSGKLSRAWKGGGGGDDDGGASDDCRDYAAEQDGIQPHVVPLIWGGGCAMVALFSMRMGRRYQAHRARVPTLGARSGGASQTSTHNVAATRGGGNANLKPDSLEDVRRSAGRNPFVPLEKPSNDPGASDASALPVDVAVSMLVGISASLFLTRPRELMRDFAEAPLSEGRSALAEELCVPFRAEMEEVNRTRFRASSTEFSDESGEDGSMQSRRTVPHSDLWKDENLGDYDSLRAVRDFVRNCRVREERARRLVEEEGGRGDATEQELMEVKIPRSGMGSDADAWMEGGDS